MHVEFLREVDQLGPHQEDDQCKRNVVYMIGDRRPNMGPASFITYISVKSTRGTTAWMYTVSLPRLEDVGQDRSKVSEYHFYLLFDDDLYEIFADNKKIAVLGEGVIRLRELGGKFE